MRVEDLLVDVTESWVADPDGDVVWAGDHEGRRGVRMQQTVRDFTTVWFGVGERTLSVEAGVVPEPRHARDEVYRQCLLRNRSTRRMRFALDPDGEVLLVGSVPIAEVTREELELVLGEVWDLIEVSFKPLIRAGFAREK